MKPTKTLLITAPAIITLAASTWMSGAQTLTFDDLPDPTASGKSVPNTYGGLQWQNINYIDGLNVDGGIPSGYQNAIVSPDNVAFSPDSEPGTISGPAFTLSSAYVTAGWRDGLQLEVQGYVGNTLTYDSTYTVDTSGPTLLNFNYVGVDKVVLTPSGGTLNPNFHDPNSVGNYEEYVMDNLTVNAVPEPSTFALAGLGGMLLAFQGFRRRCASLA